MSETETRQFRMHPKLLYDVILRQAGSLSKAILEGVMNSVDAKAKKCEIVLGESSVTIADDGQGFRSRDEVKTFFEVFGMPHDAQEQKTFGTFRMGRGQLFAYGPNTWWTQDLSMEVDIKNNGLEYKIVPSPKHWKGCKVLVELYNPLMPSQKVDTEHDLKLWCRWMPIAVYLNGGLISNDPKDFDWTLETDEAYIELDERPELNVYNLGAHVKGFAKHQFGVGGEVVTKQQLQVNFARNDIQSSCPVWKKVLPKVDQYAKDRNTHKKSLDDAARYRLAYQAKRGDLPWGEFVDLPLFTAVTGRHYKVFDLSSVRSKLTVTRKGDRLGDTLHRQRIAFVLAAETLQRFAQPDLKGLMSWLNDYFTKDGRAEHYNPLRNVQIVDFAKLTQGMDLKMEVLPTEKLRPNERVWVDLIETIKWQCRIEKADRWNQKGPNSRKTVIGIGKGVAGWTDAETYVAINRDWLSRSELDVYGFSRVALLMLHEYCHESPDLEDHDHDQAFYEKFHDAAEGFVGTFIHGCVARLPQVLTRFKKKLTRRQLRQQDQLVEGQRRTEDIEKIAAKT